MELLIYNLEVAVCLAVLYFLYFVFFRSTTFHQLNRAVVLLSLLTAFVFPMLEFQSDLDISSEFRIVELQDEVTSLETKLIEVQANTNKLVKKKETSFFWSEHFLYGMMAFWLLKYIYSNIKIVNLIRKSHLINHKGNSLYLSNKDLSPFTYFNKIVMPRSMFESENREAVIAHELIHAKQWHNPDLHLINILKSFQFFNPFIYLFEKELKATHEYIADSVAVRDSNNKSDYMQSLLSISLGANVTGIADSFNGIKLIRRLKMLNKEKSGSTVKLKYLALLPVLAGLFFVFACTEQGHFGYRNEDNYVRADSFATTSIKMREEIQKRLRLSEEWKNGTKCAKFIVSYEVDTNGNIREPYISNAKFAQSKKWSLKSIDKDIELQIIQAVKDINPKYRPALKDGKPVLGTAGCEILLGSRSKWNTYNAAGKVSVKLADRDYTVGYINPSEQAENKDDMGLPLLSHTQCQELPKLMEYPDAAREAKAIGYVELTFKVNKEGNATNIRVIKGMDYGCDEAAVAALTKLGGFRPNQTFDGQEQLNLTLKYRYGSYSTYKP